MTISVPLNQVYRQAKTFELYPKIKLTYDELTQFNIDNQFYKKIGDDLYIKGRRYDNAVLFHNDGVDFNGKIVCELGARDGIFSSWLTKFVDKIYVSDYFEEWGKNTEYDLGSFDYWDKLWKKAAYHPEKMITSTQNMLKLDYPDNFFDIVVCTSVIEHTFNQEQWMGDMVAIREIVRITKPGGKILLSTDMAEKTKWHSGTLYYSKIDIFDRIINPSGCHMDTYDFNLDHPDNTDLHQVDELQKASSVVFSLTKPL